MFRKNNSRQNDRKSTRAPDAQGHRGSGGPQKSVSPNYRVDLMAHTFTQQTGGGPTGYGPRQGSAGFGNPSARPQQPRHQQPRPQHQPPRPQHQQPRPPQHQQARPQQAPHHRPAQQAPAVRKGHTVIAIEVRDELLPLFKEKTASEGKTEHEVINQLIDLYSAGKITIS